ncbi:MAG: family 2 glycosyl transferase [Peptoclostridium sp.]|uniref:family 2 glycosyl transferase n=1 Tax=Peptoclostridium sp. TaxID=1904860 RepID=UPI00139ECBE8|nr:family 2 glycosyl transferase [Peptoclostridium sp.]MZQ75377.1 family 2 glycosyl transferase [Peptoclostridium sp.]
MKMNIKQIASAVLIVSMLAVMTGCGAKTSGLDNEKIPEDANGIKHAAKIEGRSFYVYSGGDWEKKFLKGVNIGAGKPGHFPGELAITKEEYMRWFAYISEMNAEVIRVYTTMKPEFYDALYDFNRTSSQPLYLMQGVWINEDDIETLKDAYAANGKIKNNFIKDTKDLVDIIHGKASLPSKPGFASGTYKSDVSRYVIGWILGIEWDPNFVTATNNANPDKASYSGKYLYTQNASPFEAFLCEVGDSVIGYEASEYGMARPLSFTNWLTTDTLEHPNEPFEQEDMAQVDTEHIKKTELFTPGVFASYHVYPYYPDFMSYQREYASFKDESGKVNTYRAYLRDLFKQHTVPVLVAEFGVPASRGMAHESLYSGYNQGNLDETKQGGIQADLLKDIYEEGYCGGIVFAWQDEWFKRTWNTADFDLPDTRPYWSNPQTNEQQFGLLAFDPGQKKSVCYVDGDVDEWEDSQLVYSDENVRLHVKSDEKYIYLMAAAKNYDFEKDELLIPIDILQGQGNLNHSASDAKFQKPADFLVKISGKKDSRILVDAYYDSFNYMYAERLKMIDSNPEYKKSGSGIFNPMYLCLGREIYLPQDKKTVPFSKYETGLLAYGDANPKHESFNSLADFCEKNGNVEIRIPWQLLNVMDPSTKAIMGDLYENEGFKPQKTEGFNIGCGVVKGGKAIAEIGMDFYSWDAWEQPTYHERLKPSYYILKQAFEKYN